MGMIAAAATIILIIIIIAIFHRQSKESMTPEQLAAERQRVLDDIEAAKQEQLRLQEEAAVVEAEAQQRRAEAAADPTAAYMQAEKAALVQRAIDAKTPPVPKWHIFSGYHFLGNANITPTSNTAGIWNSGMVTKDWVTCREHCIASEKRLGRPCLAWTHHSAKFPDPTKSWHNKCHLIRSPGDIRMVTELPPTFGVTSGALY